jgi:heme exporter protein C
MYSFATTLMRLRTIVLTREADTTWARETVASEGGKALPTGVAS